MKIDFDDIVLSIGYLLFSFAGAFLLFAMEYYIITKML